MIQAVENPTHQEIRDVLSAAGMKVGVENKLYSRERSKELLYRGRIRVQLKSDDGKPLNPDFPSRKLNFMAGACVTINSQLVQERSASLQTLQKDENLSFLLLLA